MPEPGSKRYDTLRSRLRREAERSGISDQDADRAADEELQEGDGMRGRGPRTEHGRGPEGERPGGSD
ncbi:hypothetical protein ACIRFH_22400 [Streptomyces sp. NPDC093586]|uniref:hypothetical protein n=1 Tax=Streptomyces sp. NPDC093586 TaxID=3366042 RepID=UPI0038189E95